MITKKAFEKYCCKHGLKYQCEDDFLNSKLNEDWNKYIFSYLCGCGFLETAKWLYSMGGIDIHARHNEAFYWSCVTGHKETAEWCYSFGNITLYEFNDLFQDELFIRSCENGYLELSKWMYSLNELGGIKKRTIETIFIECCSYENKEMIEWCHSLLDKSSVEIYNYTLECAFIRSCLCGRKKNAEWLYFIGKINRKTQEEAFIIYMRNFYYCKELIEWFLFS